MKGSVVRGSLRGFVCIKVPAALLEGVAAVRWRMGIESRVTRRWDVLRVLW